MKTEKAILLTLLLAAAALYFLVNPAQVSWLPVCPLYKLTGWQCPFCGAQRMTHALLHLNIPEAWRSNAALLLALPYSLLLYLLHKFQNKKSPKHNPLITATSQFLLSKKAALFYLTLSLLWMIARNI